MAQYKLGNRFLDEAEYEGEVIMIWGFWLFVMGALIAGSYLHSILPEDWSKEMRFAGVVIGSGVSGGILAYLAPYIRVAFFIGMFAAVISGALYWVWSFI